MEKMIQKSVRIPSGLVEYVDSQPGADFSKKLVGILAEYKDGEIERELMLQRYDEKIAKCRQRLDALMRNINRATMISRRVEALFEEVDAAEPVSQ